MAATPAADESQEQYAPLLGMTADRDEALPSDDQQQPAPEEISTKDKYQLYTSHFLSTWNSRLFEFGAVLFLASIFPRTLLPMSVYALVRSAAAIVFAQPMGRWIDRGDRLAVVRASIVGQRIAVAVSCGILAVMEMRVVSQGLMVVLFVALVAMACVEKLCSIMNLISVERDWVVVMTQDHEGSRQVVNAQMRRIDLLCKLLGPLAISFVDMISTQVAIWVILGTNIVSVFVEYACIARVYWSVPALQRLPTQDDREAEPSSLRSCSFWSSLLPISALPRYFSHSAFLPSFSLSLLYLTVLSFSGQMITYLVSVGYTSSHVGIIRTLGTIFEISATWVAPRLMGRIGAIRGGLWSLSWQMIWLAAGVSWLFTDAQKNETNSMTAATGLAVTVAMSRLGLWGFDLCAQLLVQEEVEAESRGAFSTVEAAFQNLFELMSFATTIVFSRPEDFKWPVVISVAAVYTAGGLYAFFVRKRRGHLLHVPPCMECKS